jgi:hypothetical protein
VTFDATVVAEPPDTTTGARDSRAEPAENRRRWRVAAALIGLFLLGVLARSVAVDGSNSILVRWLPWMQRTEVTMYYADEARDALVPVSRSLDRDATVEDFVVGYLEGPAPDTGLVSPLPAGLELTAVSVDGKVLQADLAGDRAALDKLGQEALRQTLLAWKGVEAVTVAVDGIALDGSTEHLLFFYDEARDMLVAEPVDLDAPRDVLAAYLAGPQDAGLVGLPGDVELISFEYDPSRELVRLNFTFTDLVSDYALDHPQATRRVLEGLIATMTIGFPQFQGVYLDFEGRSALGVGQCADLLRNLQVTPETLNDERLLARSAP